MEDVRMAGTLETDNAVKQRAFKRTRKGEVNRKWHEKRMRGQFVREKPKTVDK